MLTVLIAATLARAARALPATDPGFASCAAYYFLAARGHGMRDYDRLYAAGEFALNTATGHHGQVAAQRKMEQMSGVMMRAIHQDWREIAILDASYRAPCESLLREAGYAFE